MRKSGNDRCKGSGSHVEERRGVELFLGTGLRLAWTDGLGRGTPVPLTRQYFPGCGRGEISVGFRQPCVHFLTTGLLLIC